ncbi:BTB/POZ domain-containing protein KCTD2-like [Saccostrea echinata]|uniref:BTB/POZ domain-containing protein KCTD2-like n=1 Tax=Saccostrea echinata TaxID=191078 RepID=UPI002A7FC96F|nr:BTB/POZ domain-containing protein KCTD2-like [Saccostrea echinata]XP_061190171.1 BTB/POZ domain-containing protein KCTD2-like [Saccostrea echinata]
MPSTSSRSRSRSPVGHRDYDEISIDADDQFEREEEDIKVLDGLERMQKDIIQLDIGGYKFKTTSRTVNQIPSKLSKLISLKSSGNVPSYFVDRDPKHFGIILNYLRNNGEIDVRTLPDEKSALAAIMVECKFYGLVELESKVKKRLEMCRCQHMME